MGCWFVLPLAVLSATRLAATEPVALTVRTAAEPVVLTVHTDQTTKTIGIGIYGQSLDNDYGGLWGNQILNGALEPRPAPDYPVKGPRPLPNWEYVGDADIERGSVRITAKSGIRQRNIALKQGEKYLLTLQARGTGSAIATFQDGDATVFTKTFAELTPEFQKFNAEFAVPQTVDSAALTISSAAAGPVNIGQVSLFSASALATGGYRADLLKAVADLQPAFLRWPGWPNGSRYVWPNGIGPHAHQFGTDEFLRLCEKTNAEPVLVLNTSRGVNDALHWLEYCVGDASTEYGKQRVANGHPAPYPLKTIEIEDDATARIPHLEIVNRFCPAVRVAYPNLKLSVFGGYTVGSKPIPNDERAPPLIQQAGKLFDLLSAPSYPSSPSVADNIKDLYKYEQFLKGRGELIKKSDNPNIKIYVSEWNLPFDGEKGTDWRFGLCTGCILNVFEHQGNIVAMACPTPFMHKLGERAYRGGPLISFDQKSWFPGGNYVVMKLLRESFAPNLLAVEGPDSPPDFVATRSASMAARRAVEGPDSPLNFVATRSADKQTVFLKAVNPTGRAVEAAVRLDGNLAQGPPRCNSSLPARSPSPTT